MGMKAERVEDTTALGQQIRRARKEQGLTQQELADAAGVGVRFLSELERGKESAEVGLVLKVLHCVGYNVILEPRSLRYTRLFAFPDQSEER